MTKTKVTPEQKIQIVLESIKANIGTAELCRKHNVYPTTFQTWRQQFLDADKARLAHHGNADPTKASKKEIDNLRLQHLGVLTSSVTGVCGAGIRSSQDSVQADLS